MDLLEEALTSCELDELDDFLRSDTGSEWLAGGSMLHGFFSALAVGPLWVPASKWLRFVWGEDGPTLESSEAASRFVELLYRFYDSVRRVLQEMPEEYSPMLAEGEDQSVLAKEWSMGFCLGLQLEDPNWKLALSDENSFVLLGPVLKFAFPDEMEEHLGPDSVISEEEYLGALYDCVPKLYDYWRPRRKDWPIPDSADDLLLPPWAKIAIDAPCPCGSGRRCRECSCAAPN